MLLFILIKLFLFIVFAYLGGFILLILISPWLSYVSEKTEEIISGNIYKFNIVQFFKDILRGAGIAFRNMIYQLFIVIGLFLLSFFPFIGLFTPLLLFIVSSYYYGYSFVDYSLERRKFSIKESNIWISGNKKQVVGNGMFFSLILMIPYVGVFIAVFMSVISVMSATILVFSKEKD